MHPLLVLQARKPMYGIAKQMAENLSLAASQAGELAATVLRFWWGFGDDIGGRHLREMLISAAAGEKLSVPGDSGGSFLHLEDFSSAVKKILLNHAAFGRVYNLGSVYVTWEEVARMAHDSPVWTVAFSPDGQWLASGSGGWRGVGGDVQVWDISAGLTGAGTRPVPITEVARMPHEAIVETVAFSPDGLWVASAGGRVVSAGDNAARVWETATGEEIARMDHEETAVAVEFSPNGRWVASGSRNWLDPRGGRGEVRVWEAATGREVARMDHEDGVYVVAFSPDGQWVASGSGSAEGGSGRAQVWEVATGREVARMDHEHSVGALAFSADGRWLASGSADNTVRVWEAATGEEVARMAHEDEVWRVAFSSDGQWLASGSYDGTTRVWLWRPEDLIAQACGRLSRNMTLEEWEMYFRDQPYRCTCPNLPPGEGTLLDACPRENQP